MLDEVLDNFRKATESTLQLQREMVREWGQLPGVRTPGAVFANPWAEEARAFQKKWAEGVIEILTKNRESLSEQYLAGIRTIQDVFRVAEARDPEQFRKLIEELWRDSFDCLKTAVEAQLRDFQAAAEKGIETMSQTMTANRS